MAILLALFLKIMSESLNVNTAGAGFPVVGDSKPNDLQTPTFDKHHIQTMMQNSSKLLSGVKQLSEDVSNRKAQQYDTHSKAPDQQDRVAKEKHQVEGEQQHDQSQNTSRRKRKHNHKNTKGKGVKETHSDDHDAASSSKSSHDGADDQKEVGLFPKPTSKVPKEVVNEKAATEEEEEGSAATAKVTPRADVPANEGALKDDDDSDEVDAGAPSLVNVPGAGAEEAPDDEGSLGETMGLRVPDEEKVSDNEGSSSNLSEDDDDSDEVDAGAPSSANVPGAGEEEAQNNEGSSGETMDSIALKKRFNEWLGLRVLDEGKVSDDEGSSNDLSKEDDDETFDDDFVYDDEEVDTATHEVPTNDEAPVLKRVSSKDAAQMLKDIFKNY